MKENVNLSKEIEKKEEFVENTEFDAEKNAVPTTEKKELVVRKSTLKEDHVLKFSGIEEVAGLNITVDHVKTKILISDDKTATIRKHYFETSKFYFPTPDLASTRYHEVTHNYMMILEIRSLMSNSVSRDLTSLALDRFKCMTSVLKGLVCVKQLETNHEANKSFENLLLDTVSVLEVFQILHDEYLFPFFGIAERK